MWLYLSRCWCGLAGMTTGHASLLTSLSGGHAHFRLSGQLVIVVFLFLQHTQCIEGSKWIVFIVMFSPDPPENCQLNVQKLPKTWHLKKRQKMTIFVNFFEKNVKFLAILDIQLAIFRRVRSELNQDNLSMIWITHFVSS